MIGIDKSDVLSWQRMCHSSFVYELQFVFGWLHVMVRDCPFHSLETRHDN
jgi:hypothetical protein